MVHNPNVSHMRVFGSKAWARIPYDKRKYFQPQSSEFILLGYADDAKYYKLMEFTTKICFIERSVQFNKVQLHDLQIAQEEGVIAQSIPFAYEDVSTDVSNSKSEYEDQEEQDLDIENEDQEDLDPTLAPNPRPKWAQKLIEAIGNNVGDPSSRRRTISQFQDENLALCHTDPLLPERCYMMLGFDPQSYKEACHYPGWKEDMDDEYDSL